MYAPMKTIQKVRPAARPTFRPSTSIPQISTMPMMVAGRVLSPARLVRMP